MAESKKTITSGKGRDFVSPMLARYLGAHDSSQAFRAGQHDFQSRTTGPRKMQMGNVAGEVGKREDESEGG